MSKEEEIIDALLNVEEETPKFGSDEWDAYVLEQFDEKELQEGNPKVVGLRRVTSLLLGPILRNETTIISVPTQENGWRAVAQSIIEVGWMLDDKLQVHSRVFSDVADAYPENSLPPYDRHLVSVASTRAEGRALRKALQLTTVVAAEELIEMVTETKDDDRITGTQIQTIKLMCGKLKIDVNKFINMGEEKYDQLTDVLYGKAIKMLERLNEYQQGKKQVPATIKRDK